MIKSLSLTKIRNNPFCSRVFHDMDSIEFPLEGRCWDIEKFLQEFYEILEAFVNSDKKNKKDFYDFFLFEKFSTLYDGYRFTVEFVVSSQKFTHELLEVKIQYQLVELNEPKDAISFWLRSKKIAEGQINTNSLSCDKMLLNQQDMKLFCDRIFNNSSTQNKIFEWIKNENSYLKDQRDMNSNNPQIRKLSEQIGPNFVSVTYFLEYLQKDHLFDKKRLINCINDQDTQLTPEDIGKNTQQMTNFNLLLNDTNSKLCGCEGKENIQFDKENNHFESNKQKQPFNTGSDANTEKQQPFSNTMTSLSFNLASTLHESSIKYKTTIGKKGLKYQTEDFSKNDFDQAEKKKKMCEGITKMTAKMDQKRKALATIQGLFRAIDPIDDDLKTAINGTKKKFLDEFSIGLTKQKKIKILNTFTESEFKTFETLLPQSNIFSDFNKTVKEKGVKIAKEYREIGIPYAKRIDQLINQMNTGKSKKSRNKSAIKNSSKYSTTIKKTKQNKSEFHDNTIFHKKTKWPTNDYEMDGMEITENVTNIVKDLYTSLAITDEQIESVEKKPFSIEAFKHKISLNNNVETPYDDYVRRVNVSSKDEIYDEEKLNTFIYSNDNDFGLNDVNTNEKYESPILDFELKVYQDTITNKNSPDNLASPYIKLHSDTNPTELTANPTKNNSLLLEEEVSDASFEDLGVQTSNGFYNRSEVWHKHEISEKQFESKGLMTSVRDLIDQECITDDHMMLINQGKPNTIYIAKEEQTEKLLKSSLYESKAFNQSSMSRLIKIQMKDKYVETDLTDSLAHAKLALTADLQMMTDNNFEVQLMRRDSSNFDFSRKPSIQVFDIAVETDSNYFKQQEMKDMFDKSIQQDSEIYEQYLEEVREEVRNKIMAQLEEEKETSKSKIIETSDKNVATIYQEMVNQETFTLEIQKSEKNIGTESLLMVSKISETMGIQQKEFGTNTENEVYLDQSEFSVKNKKIESIDNSKYEEDYCKTSLHSVPLIVPNFNRLNQSETTSIKDTSQRRRLKTLSNLDNDDDKKSTISKSTKKRDMSGQDDFNDSMSNQNNSFQNTSLYNQNTSLPITKNIELKLDIDRSQGSHPNFDNKILDKLDQPLEVSLDVDKKPSRHSRIATRRVGTRVLRESPFKTSGNDSRVEKATDSPSSTSSGFKKTFSSLQKSRSSLSKKDNETK